MSNKYLISIPLISLFLLKASYGIGQNYNEIAKIVASDREDIDSYGSSVDISGDYAIIGAPKEDHDLSGANFAADAGAGYIVEKDGSGNWVEVQKLVASDRAAYDQFGHSVAISGDYAVVGAHKDFGERGSAYIFERDGSGNWIQVQKITASVMQGYDRFGTSVSVSGGYIIVGAHQSDKDAANENSLSNAGAAYVFARDGSGTWSETHKLVASDRGAEDLFGYSVAISGSYAIVGAYQEDEDDAGSNTLASAGAAYMFFRDGSGDWAEVSKHVASDREAGAQFGYSVSIYSTFAVIGANKESKDADGLNPITDAGAVYFLEKEGVSEWSEVKKVTSSYRSSSDEFGSAAAITYGYATVGAYKDHSEGGSVHVFQRNSADQWAELQYFSSSDRERLDKFGLAVAMDGTNLISGAPGQDYDSDGLVRKNIAGASYIFEYTNSFRPSFISSAIASLSENTLSGSIVLDVNANNGDGGSSDKGITYSLLAYNEDDLFFDIDSESGQMTINFLPDYESPADENMDNVYSIGVRAFDGAYYTNQFIGITVTDVDESIVWDGSVWNNDTGPSDIDDVKISGDYSGGFECANLVVESGNTLTVSGENTLKVNGTVTNDGAMIVESGSSLITYETKSFTGNPVTIKRLTRYSNGKYSFVGTPVQQNASVTAATLGSNVYYYDETQPYSSNEGLDRWIPATGELVPGVGYTQANQQEITFIGLPNVGDILYSGTYTEDTDDANEAWNFISNPYPAAINVMDFLGENADNSGAVYFWDDNGSNTQRGTNADYIVANGAMATATAAGGHNRYNFHIGSGQGFFIKLTEKTATDVLFVEDLRVSGFNSEDNFFRETKLPIARINLTNNHGLFKQAVVGFANDATEDELNRSYDAQAFNASSEDGLFTMKAGRALSLNGMKLDWETIQLQLNAKEAGQYQISVELEEYDQNIFLKDNLTEEVIDLRNGAYAFTAQAGINTDRFELLSSPSNVLGLENEEAFIYTSDKMLHIEKQTKEPREYQLFDMNGKQLISTSVKREKEVNLSSYPSGIYLVFDGQKTHKIILK